MPIEIICRAEALAKGLPEYFTGKPCRRGHIAPRRFLGKCGVCVKCRKINTADYRDEHRDELNEKARNDPGRTARQQRYVENHADRKRKSALDYIARNRDNVREYQRELKKRLRATNADWRFRTNLRGRLHKALTRASALKSGKTMELIGCTVAYLKAHLEAQFTDGMTWGNYGHGDDLWSVDHRIPCAAYDLTDPEQQRACFNFSNLQPMWHPENVAKGARYDVQSVAV